MPSRRETESFYIGQTHNVQVLREGMTRNEGREVDWKQLVKTLDAELRNLTLALKELCI